ncbi:mitochondrial carrier domain-containing protein [Blakeslea trispora]|nr:mitochondrial carrier domain-containing protein [Blakeslea trispora]
MTLTAYLGFLSLGSTIQTRHSVECQQEQAEELKALEAIAQAISSAEIDTVSTVSVHHAPSERRVEIRENIMGVTLAIGTMVANYSLCFPIVAARHRLQALPTHQSYARDTPLYGARTILATYRQGGLRRLYPGFGLGLMGQAISASYESCVHQIISHLLPSSTTLVKAITKCLSLAIQIPLYPLYRNALIMRVQSNPTLICSVQDFVRLYRRDLALFWTPSSLSVFIPSCLLNALTEKLLIAIYRRIFHMVTETDDSEKMLKKNKRKEGTVLQTFYPEIACGVISSIVTRALSYPMDTIIFKLMVQGSGVLASETNYNGFLDCVQQTWYHEGGWKAFYPGWGIGVLEVGMGYLILEASWWAYRFVQWKLQALGSSDTRTVRKAKKLRDRFAHS